MKIISFGLLLIVIAIKISANENWITIEPINQTKISKPDTNVDINLSQIEPVNKIMKNATVIKQFIDATSKKDEPTANDKNWFILNTKDSK